MTTEAKPPAGWYPDPSQPMTMRYWSGSEWTTQRSPMQQPQPQPQQERVADGVMALGVLTGIFIPLIGFIIGLTQINKKGGGAIVATSVVAFFVWILIMSGA